MVVKPRGFRKKTKGFTLIELMLASALLMTVLYAGYYAFSLYSSKWDKRVNVFWNQTKEGIALNTVVRLLQSSSKYVTSTTQNKQALLFDADQQFIRFVTETPIYSRGTAIVELRIETSQSGIQKQLLYRELDISGKPLLQYSDKIAEDFQWQHSRVLLSGYQHISWQFYSYEAFEQALSLFDSSENTNRTELREYRDSHSFEVMRILPDVVKIDVSNDKGVSNIKISLPNNSLSTLVANMRVDA